MRTKSADLGMAKRNHALPMRGAERRGQPSKLGSNSRDSASFPNRLNVHHLFANRDSDLRPNIINDAYVTVSASTFGGCKRSIAGLFDLHLGEFWNGFDASYPEALYTRKAAWIASTRWQSIVGQV